MRATHLVFFWQQKMGCPDPSPGSGPGNDETSVGVFKSKRFWSQPTLRPSKLEREIHGAELIGGRLGLVFLRAEDMGERYLHEVERYRGAHFQIAHENVLGNPAAGLPA